MRSLPKRAPALSVHSMPQADGGPKSRLRRAYRTWADAVDGKREAFCDVLGATFGQLKGWLSSDEMRNPPLAVVEAAERAAAEATDRDVDDAVLGQARKDALRAVARVVELERRYLHRIREAA